MRARASTRTIGRLVGAALALGVAFGGLAAPAGAQDEQPPPYSQWSADRIAGLDTLFTQVPCPLIAGLTATDRVETTTRTVQGLLEDGSPIELLDVAQDPSVRCSYTDDETNQPVWFSVHFTRDGEQSTSYCTAEPVEGSTAQLGNLDPDRAISGQYSVGSSAPAVGVAFDARAREMAAVLAPATRGCPPEPVQPTCPQIADFTAADVRVDVFSGAPDTYKVTCGYTSADEATQPSIRLDLQVSWIPPRATSAARFESLCATETGFDRGWGTISGDGLAIRSVYGITSVDPIDPAPIEAATRDLISQVSGQAQFCDGVEFTPRSQQFTPIPAPYAAAFTPELVSGRTPVLAPVDAPAGTAPAPPAQDPSPTAPPAPSADAGADDDQAQSSASARASSDGSLGSGLAMLLRVVTIVLLVVSLLGLALTFLLIRRETRLRPKIDFARLIIVSATAVAMMLIFSKGAPVWAVGVAVGAGLGLGYLQGQNVAVRLTERGLMAKRTSWAIVAFAASLILSQIAGLLNRTGAIALGIALSFLSAALTAGLLVGRHPRIVQARQAVAGATLVLLIVVLPVAPLLLYTGRAEAQDAAPPVSTDDLEIYSVTPDERTPEHDALIDFVPWQDTQITGGLWWDSGKPFTPAPVSRALDAVPEPITRTVEWTALAFDGAEAADTFSVTETFEFSPRSDGWCCSVAYSGEGTRTPANGDPETWVVDGTLDDIHSVAIEGSGFINPSSFGGQPFTEVREWDAPAESAEPTQCRRAVAITRRTRLLENSGGEAQLSITVNGESGTNLMNPLVVLGIPCDIPGLSLQAVLDAAPPPPPRDDEDRRGCPVVQEVLGALSADTTLEGFEARTLADAFFSPNDSLCIYGALAAPPAIGQGGRGNTRIEFAADVAMPRQGEWDLGYSRWASRDNQTFAFGPSDIEERNRCQFEPDGTPIAPEPGRTCAAYSLHRVDLPGPSAFRAGEPPAPAGWVQIFTDFNRFDGPNVLITAGFPWGSYYARCHHCSPTDPEVVAFVSRLHDLYNGGHGSFGGEEPEPDESEGEASEDGQRAEETDEASAEGSDTEVSADDTEVVTDERVTTGVADVLAEDDEETREAAAVAILAALAVAGLVGASLLEAGLSVPELVEAWRRGGASGVDAAVAARAGPTLSDDAARGADEDPVPGGDELRSDTRSPPDGSTRVEDHRGVTIERPDGTVTTESPDGWVRTETADGHITYRWPEGSEPRTVIVGGFTDEDGNPQIDEIRPDGTATRVTLDEDGETILSETTFPPGGTTTGVPIDDGARDTATAGVPIDDGARDMAAALRPGGVDVHGDLPPEEGPPTAYPEDGEIRDSVRVDEALDRLPVDVQRLVEEQVRAGLEREAAAEALERARQAIGEVDPSLDDVGVTLRDNPEVEEALRQLPDEVRRQVEADLIRQMEQERVDAATAATRAALERQRATELVREALDRGDAEAVEQIIEQLPEDARDQVWDEATAGRPPVDMDAMRAAQEPGTGEPAPDNLLPDGDVHEVMRDNPEVEEALEQLPAEVRSQVEQQVRTDVEIELTESARDRARQAIGEVDQSLDDVSEVLRDNPEVEEALRQLPEEVRRQVEADLIRQMEQERLDAATAAARAALERQRAIVLVQEAVTSGDAERVDEIMQQLPEDARGDVWDAATGGEGVDLDAMRAEQQPGTGEPSPESLLPDPDDDLHVIVVESPTVDEVLDELPSEVRTQVEQRVMTELEAELVEAARRGAREAIGEVDPSLDDVSEVLRDNPQVEEVLRHLPESTRRQVEADLLRAIEQERLEAATAAALHAAELDRAEAEVRSALDAGQLSLAQSILQGLDPADAQAVSEAIQQSVPPGN